MQKKRMLVITLMICMTSSLFLFGCTSFDNFKSSFITTEVDDENTVRIGVFEPLSGAEKEHGELELEGIELAHELFPEVIGKQIQLVYADNQSDVDVAVSAAQDLVDKKVSVVLGSHGSTLSLAGGDVFEQAQIPAITITSTNPLVTKSNPYYFRTCILDSFQGVALAKYCVEYLGMMNAAIFKDAEDDYAAAVAQTYSDKMTQLTGNENAIIKTIEYTSKKKNFETQLQSVKDSGATVVLLASKDADAIRIMKQAKELGMNFVFLGTESWQSESFLAEGGTDVNGAIFSAFFDADTAINPNTEVFIKAYQEKYGTDAEPSSDVALGFDSYMLAVNAISRAGTSIDGEAIRNQLAATKSFPGASGNFTFDENGDPIKSVVIETIANGKFVHLYTVEPTWQ